MKSLMFHIAIVSFFAWSLMGCASGKTAVRILEDAAKLAAGPCLDKVAEAAATCRAQYEAIPK